MNCPNCNSSVKELLACDICNSIGCIRCVIRLNKQWVCGKCKNGTRITQTAENALAYMFG